MLERLVLKNAADRTSHRLGPLGRLVARSLDRLVARSLDYSIARSLDRSIDRSLDRSIDRSIAWTECRLKKLTLGRT